MTSRSLLNAALFFVAMFGTVERANASWAYTGYFYISSLGDLWVLEMDGMQVFPPSTEPVSSTNPHSCTGNDRWVVKSTDAAYKTKAATLLAAYVSSKRIRLAITGDSCSGSGTSGYPVIIGVEGYLP